MISKLAGRSGEVADRPKGWLPNSNQTEITYRIGGVYQLLKAYAALTSNPALVLPLFCGLLAKGGSHICYGCGAAEQLRSEEKIIIKKSGRKECLRKGIDECQKRGGWTVQEGDWCRGGQVELAQKKRISTYNEFLLQTRESCDSRPRNQPKMY